MTDLNEIFVHFYVFGGEEFVSRSQFDRFLRPVGVNCTFMSFEAT